jgi:hypothetical protein
LPTAGAITQVTRPDGSSRLISNTDKLNPHYVNQIEDEKGAITKISRDGNNRAKSFNFDVTTPGS